MPGAARRARDTYLRHSRRSRILFSSKTGNVNSNDDDSDNNQLTTIIRPGSFALPRSPAEKDRSGLPICFSCQPLLPLPFAADAPTNTKQSKGTQNESTYDSTNEESGDTSRSSADSDSDSGKEEDLRQLGTRMDLVPAGDVARCSSCGAYINMYCTFHRRKWRCSICGNAGNAVTDRYASLLDRPHLPELCVPALEFVSEGEFRDFHGSKTEDNDSNIDNEDPVFVILLDAAAAVEELAVLLRGAHALLNVLPACARLGIVLFSERVGAFQLQCTVPHVRWTAVSAVGHDSSGGVRGSGCVLGLGELFGGADFADLFPRLDAPSARDRVGAALDGLGIASGVGSDSIALHRAVGAAAASSEARSRAFGAAVRAVLDVFADPQCRYRNVRMTTFLAGLPNYGIGAVISERQARSACRRTEHDGDTFSCEAALQPSTDFYIKEAERAAANAVCIDMFLISDSNRGSVGLRDIKFLSLKTGGNIQCYETVNGLSAADQLPRDVFALYRRTLGFGGLLKVRVGTKLKVENAGGHLVRDDLYSDLYHVAGIDPCTSFVFDLGFAVSDGYIGEYDANPCFQIAFAYTRLDPEPELDEEVEHSTVARWRLRVCTVPLLLAASVADIYQHVNADVVASNLMHQTIRASLDHSVAEARLLVLEWLSILIAKYSQQLRSSRRQREHARTFDTGFSQSPAMRMLPKLVFALRKSPVLMIDHRQAIDVDCSNLIVSNDRWCAVQAECSSLPPRLLQLALYPSLNTYTKPTRLQSKAVSLSSASVTSLEARIAVVRTPVETLCFYLPTKTSDSIEIQEFPPPSDSILARDIARSDDGGCAQLPSLRRPRLLRCGIDAGAGELLQKLLIEDDDGFGESFQSFLDAVVSKASDIEFG